MDARGKAAGWPGSTGPAASGEFGYWPTRAASARPPRSIEQHVAPCLPLPGFLRGGYCSWRLSFASQNFAYGERICQRQSERVALAQPLPARLYLGKTPSLHRANVFDKDKSLPYYANAFVIDKLYLPTGD